MRKVEASIEIHQPASIVFDAFIDPVMLKEWWGVQKCLIEKKQGGLYSLTWDITDKGFHYISTGVITVFIPGKELLIDHFIYFNPEKSILGPTYLAIKLKESNGISNLLLTQGNYQNGEDWEWYYNAVTDAWPKVLEALKNYLEK